MLIWVLILTASVTVCFVRHEIASLRQSYRVGKLHGDVTWTLLCRAKKMWLWLYMRCWVSIKKPLLQGNNYQSGLCEQYNYVCIPQDIILFSTRGQSLQWACRQPLKTMTITWREICSKTNSANGSHNTHVSPLCKSTEWKQHKHQPKK